VRAFGALAAALWVAVALAERADWPRVGLIALGASIVAALVLRPLAAQLPRLILAPPRALFLSVCSLAAAGLTAWASHAVLRDQPLSIDAGIYLQQARAMAHGHFGMPARLPAQAFGDRFLLEGPDRRLYGIFPPGWPLAMVPFVWLGKPMLVGPALAVLMVLAQAALGRAVGRVGSDADGGELATRVSLLLSLPSIARVLETADLLSHAFVAVLVTVAVAAALGMEARAARPRTGAGEWRAALMGACAGWVTAARFLDGLVLGAVLAGILIWRRVGWRRVLWSALGVAPFVLLVAIEQHAATGAWAVPTQSLYFARSDWPATCHRLGLGPDIGCTVEHPGTVARLGGDGYFLHDALAIVRERTGALGEDLLGFPPLVLLAFAPVALGASLVDVALVAFVLALALAYGLFYYGNALYFGARHLFPAAPFAWLLVARGTLQLPHRAGPGWLDVRHVRGGGVAVLLAVAVASVVAPWKKRTHDAADFQAERSDLRRALAKRGVDRGIIKSRDLTSVASASDLWADGDERFFVLEDGSGLTELRRAHPDLPVYVSLPSEEIGKLYASRPPPGVLVELERGWPTFVRPEGLASKQAAQEGASGGMVLLLSHAQPGTQITIPFDVALAGDYEVRVDAFRGPDQGNYALELDGRPLADWQGYAAESGLRRGDAQRRALSAGRHVLVARCTGRDAASTGWDARLDALVGVPASPAAPAVSP
jgi:hypothetical protein